MKIGAGWIPIIVGALEKMAAIDPSLEIRRIKQKFGGLRIYYRSERYEQLTPAVEEAELPCGKSCEECGEPGSIFNQDGCIRTPCEQHRASKGCCLTPLSPASD